MITYSRLHEPCTMYFGHFSVLHSVQIYLSSWELESLFSFRSSSVHHSTIPFHFQNEIISDMEFELVEVGLFIFARRKKRVKRRENHLIWYITHHNIMSIRQRCKFNVWIKRWIYILTLYFHHYQKVYKQDAWKLSEEPPLTQHDLI